MPRFISLLAATTILGHAIVGCCAHEAHRPATAYRAHLDCHNSGSHEMGGHDQATETEPDSLVIEQRCECSHHSPQRTPHDCYHAQCNWLAPELRNGDDLLRLDFVANQPWSLQTPSASPLAESGVSLTLAVDHYALSVRSHLANCVLLI